MRLLVVVLLLALAGCSGKAYRLGSPIVPGTELSSGRVIEGEGCDVLFPSQERFKKAYGELRGAAGKDLITDVEVAEGARCTFLRARAVKVVPSRPSPNPDGGESPVR